MSVSQWTAQQIHALYGTALLRAPQVTAYVEEQMSRSADHKYIRVLARIDAVHDALHVLMADPDFAAICGIEQPANIHDMVADATRLKVAKHLSDVPADVVHSGT